MTIKSKLSVIFFLFISLIVVLIICLISALFSQRMFFLRYVDIRDKITLLENIVQKINSQRLYFDYYIILNDEKEKENFLSFLPTIEQSIEEYSTKEINTEVKNIYSQFISIANSIFNEPSREKKVNLAISEFHPIYRKLTEHIKERQSFYERESRKILRYVLLLNVGSLIVSVVIIVASIYIILKFGTRIYRSLISSLNTIMSFANTLSKGEYKEINITTDDEFQNVISTFNHMVRSLKNLQAQVIQMDRLSNIGQLAGGIAHEINNPLVGVLGQAQILLEQLPENSPLRENVLKIERAAQRCRDSVYKLLQFSRQKEYEYTEADIHDIIQNALFIADSELKAHNIEVVKLFGSGIKKIKVSVPHIQQVVLNIVNNAIQAMEKGNEFQNRLIIRTYMTQVEENNTTKEYVVAEFEDTGCGIEQDVLPNIFEPFFTTKDRSKFAGMGLAITKDIILHHKGKITVFSEGKNKGAKFAIYLPVQ